MKRETTLTYEFVEFIPDFLKDWTIYVSVPYTTVAHKCCCGCGKEVVTPLSPTDWKLTFDGESITLDPSIGNWSFPCQSHYWIKRNRVQWAPDWSREQIKAGRGYDRFAKKQYFELMNSTDIQHEATVKEGQLKESLWMKLKKWFWG